ncbi:hypothetical protein K458DRAFT_387779 [Lentithecium fluviatile CBS 122367]|uniref:Peptidase C14 caspase domain-containing protein n=1 Tax=Lentithecium fluviatile CBS 122367 TaxID=1168545 RepID=A0A6G1J5N1_9PLEO|nr:hypothetical protein K458DRAFT_387779 [Lentithecium fluviatile CBS 122367]
MALRFHTPSRLVNPMETEITPRASNALKDKVFHANIQIQSIEDASVQQSESSEDSRLIQDTSSAPEDVAYRERAAEMQMWWDEAIVRNMDLPDGYVKVAVLIIKWDDELDELKTRGEAEELRDIFANRFRFETETVELNVSSKPQHQINRHLSAFIEKHDGPNNLLIVYYTGHGVYREDHKHLELTASLNPMNKKGFNGIARCNWNKVEELLKAEEVECDVLTILDTCYSSNIAKSGKEETRTFELLSACAINATTAAPGDNSFTRALIDALSELIDQFGDRPFTTFHLNQRILLDKRRHDTPSQLWFRLQNHERHIRLAPLKQNPLRQSPSLPQPPRGYLTLRFALRDESLNQQQIEFLTLHLAKAFNKKALVGLRRIDWLGIKPARTTHFGRAALAMFAIAQWKRFLGKRKEEKESQRSIDAVHIPMSVEASPEASPTRKRMRNNFDDLPEPKRERDYLVIPHPPSPPVSDSSRVEDGPSEHHHD